MNKRTRPFLLALLIIFLTAQTCIGFENAGAFWDLWNADEDDIDNAEYLDCSQFAFTSFSHDANGRLSLAWPAQFASSYRLDIWHEDVVIWHAEFVAANGGSHSMTIQWSQLEGADTVEIEFVAVGVLGDTCVLHETVNRPVPPASAMNCANLRLTSPLGGMANGFETFYWDALEGADVYRLNIYDNGALLVSVDAADALNTSLDVSQAAIGGETPLTVELVAFDVNGNSCSQRYEIGREAAPAQDTQPESTPD